MTKKHFEAIANCLREELNRIDSELHKLPIDKGTELCHRREQTRHIAFLLASRLSGFNPHFNLDRFIEAALGEREGLIYGMFEGE